MAGLTRSSGPSRLAVEESRAEPSVRPGLGRALPAEFRAGARTDRQGGGLRGPDRRAACMEFGPRGQFAAGGSGAPRVEAWGYAVRAAASRSPDSSRFAT